MEAPPIVPSLPLTIVVWLFLWGGVSVWILLGARLWRGQPILRVEPRRQAPWTGLDLAGIVVFYTVALVAVEVAAAAVLGPEACKPITSASLDARHQIVQLFSGASWPVMVACTLVAVVVAPVVEEIFFRLLLQGWLEGVDRRLRPRMPIFGRWVRWGTLPVVVVAILFAMLHFRVEGPQFQRDFTLFMMLGRGAASLLTVVAALAWIAWFRGAKASDLGWRWDKLPSDVGVGLVAFLAVAVPLYALQVGLTVALPSYLAPDPVTLFFFAMVLGFLYLRTHRIVPSIVAHMALNGTGMFFLWLQVAAR